MSIKSNAEVIRDETVRRANTGARVGGNLVEIAEDLIVKQTEINLKANFLQVATYAVLTALTTPNFLTIVKVLNDENKNISNSTYHLYPDGVRMWVASTQDN